MHAAQESEVSAHHARSVHGGSVLPSSGASAAARAARKPRFQQQAGRVPPPRDRSTLKSACRCKVHAQNKELGGDPLAERIG